MARVASGKCGIGVSNQFPCRFEGLHHIRQPPMNLCRLRLDRKIAAYKSESWQE